MRNFYLILLFLFALGGIKNSHGQGFNFSLEGNPVDITNWELGSLSSVDNDEIVLTQPVSSQNGYIYYQTPQNLASCSEFTVEFDFRITQSSSPSADGISFFYITNPPAGFISGSGIGLPTNPNGLILVLDTYDNDANYNNPLISLRNMPGNVDYIEGNTANNIVPDLTNQSFISDGNWHQCVIHYEFGEISVSFNGQAPVMVGNTTINLNGYFGFSSSTGGSWARHAIKNVHIYGASEPERPEDQTFEYCVGDDVEGPLDIEGINLQWFSQPTGGTPLAGAPTPNTNVPGVYTYYLAETVPHCNLESERATIKIIVHDKALDPIVNIPIYCSGQNSTQTPLVVNSTNFQWYFDEFKTQPLDPNFNINTNAAGNMTLYLENISPFGCPSDLKHVDIPVHHTPELDFEYDQVYNCDLQDSILILNISEHADQYKWFVSDTLVSTDIHPALQISYPDIHQIKLYGENEYCHTTLIKEIETGHEFVVDFLAEPPYFCEGDVMILENTSHSNAEGNLQRSAKWYIDDVLETNTWDLEKLLPFTKTYEIELVVTNEVGCEKSIMKEIEIDPRMDKMFDIGDTAICMGDPIELFTNNQNKGIDEINVQWGDGTTWNLSEYHDLQHSFIEPGLYTIQINNHFRACPSSYQEFEVSIVETPIVRFLTQGEICLQGEEIYLENLEPYNPAYKYLWSNGDKTHYTNILTPGEYSLQVFNEYCVGKQTIHIESDCFVKLPNAFTPNGDGDNDYFFPRQALSKGLVAFEMEIYNRWGQKIFETNNVNGRGWDGKFNNIEQPYGVYVYKIVAEFKNGRSEEYHGNVTLIR